MKLAHSFAGAFILLTLFAKIIPAQPNVLTHDYDNNRAGANTQETVLTTSNVNSSQFGLLYNYSVDGSVYAQPLYVKALQIPGQGTHDVLFIATMNDKLYAFDANTNSAPLWVRDFTNPVAGITAIPITDLVGTNTLNIVGNVGIDGTPVINLTTNTMYVVVRTKENGSYVPRLHAIDITTGAEKSGSPVLIQGSVTGSANEGVGGVLSFDPRLQQQRGALSLANGFVVVPWGSHEDILPYHGWLFAYDATTLQRVGIFCTTPDGRQGGIWQAARGPVIDSAGDIYYLTGNGDWNGTREFSDSLLRLRVNSSGFTVFDWFTPADQAFLDSSDMDLGSSGPLLIPNTNYLVGGGKESILYLFDKGFLGHLTADDSGPIQKINVAGSLIMAGPVFWNSPSGPLVYLQANRDVLRSYLFNSSNPGLTPFATGSITTPGSPGGVLTISANGSTTGTGIVWVEQSTSTSSNHGLAAGTVRAYNAITLQELWNSDIAPGDKLGNVAKFNPPLVLNGRVYASSVDNVVRVYGLLQSIAPDFTISVNTSSQTVSPGNAASYPVSVAPVNGFTGTVTLSASGLPSGATAGFTPPSISGGSGNSTLQITTSASTPTGTYSITVTGTSGALVHNATTQLVVSNTSSSPRAISIDFVGNGTPMGAGESAGVVPKANWNTATGASSTAALSLFNEDGASSGATATWQSDNGWLLPITDTAGNARMMRGYLDNGSANSTVVTVANLPSSSNGYDVYVYSAGDNGSVTRTATYQISGAGIATTSIGATDAAGTTFTGTFTQANNSAGNYVKFSIGSTATGFTLTAIPGTSSDGFKRAPVNGIQIIPAAAAPNPDFSIGVTGGAQTVSPGNAASYPVSVAGVNGFTGTVTLSASGLPSGATAGFTPPSINGSGSSTLQITTTGSTPVGTYTITVTGTSGSLVHSTTTQLIVSNTGPSARAISIDFAGDVTPMSSGETAGVVPKINWNSVAGAASTSALPLLDETGVATSASLTWHSDNDWALPITDSPGNARMMHGYLDNGAGNPATATVANLPASSSGYDIYVYTAGDNGSATRTATFQISGPGITTTSISATDSAGTTFNGVFTQANNSPGNYVKFTIGASATSFTLSATPGTSTDGFKRAPINGIQVIPH